MENLDTWQLVCIGILFVWSGFVRSGLGFGGAVLTLPFLLMVDNAPLVFLPIIAIHLMFFSFITVLQSHRKMRAYDHAESKSTINLPFLRYAFALMIIPKLIGVAGVITLPADIVSSFIFVVVAVYAVSYILDRPIKSRNKWVNAFFMMMGGYVSGTSLIAAPLVVPVAAARVESYQLRDTLFVLWFVLVALKLAAFIWTGVDLQWRHQLWLLPCATVGHFIGLRFHDYTLRSDTKVFFRYLGIGLLAVSAAGLIRVL
ncbi:MAG: TSUP family transporter [Pseudomonadota bacterium]